jgi:hypothetical protein
MEIEIEIGSGETGRGGDKERGRTDALHAVISVVFSSFFCPR